MQPLRLVSVSLRCVEYSSEYDLGGLAWVNGVGLRSATTIEDIPARQRFSDIITHRRA